MLRGILISILLAGCGANTDVFLGNEYVGVKYQNSPLGEAKNPDTDPLIRFDAFDCTTFVETVVAGSNLDKLTQIRYKNGQVDFKTRNHFIESDWMNNNKDLFVNVSRRYGPVKIRSVTIDKQKWFEKNHDIQTRDAPTTVDVEYIPYKNAKNIFPEKELIVLFITDNPEMRDKIGTDLAVVHMGLLLPNGMLRHASSLHGKVVDVKMNEYIDFRAANQTELGIALVKIK